MQPMSSGPPPIPPPMQVLSYNDRVSTGKPPSVITAMGVMSIIFGAIGVIGAIASGFFSLIFLIATAATATATGPQAFAPVPVIEFAGPNGIFIADRTIIIQAFNRMQSMSPKQQSQLEFFLADVGKSIVPDVVAGGQSKFDPAMSYARANLTGSGTGVEDGSVWYDVPIGRITVTDDDASFAPNADSTTKPVRRSRTRTPPNPQDLTQLSSIEIQAVIDRVQEHAGATPLSPTLVTSLRGQLQSNPTTLLVGAPADMADMLGQVSNVALSGSTTATVVFTNATVTMSPSGVTSSFGYSANGPRGFPKMKTWPLAIVLTGAGINILLAVYLLVSGVVTLRNSPSGGKLHRIYAWIKILVTLGTATATWWMWDDFYGGIMTPTPGSPNPPFGMVSTMMTGFGVLVGLAYPIALLFMLRSKSAREYYSPVISA